MPTCVECPDGMVLCGNPPPSCDGGMEAFAVPGGTPNLLGAFSDLTVTSSNGQLQIASVPATAFGDVAALSVELDNGLTIIDPVSQPRGRFDKIVIRPAGDALEITLDDQPLDGTRSRAEISHLRDRQRRARVTLFE